jgi:hypothetical protein
MIEKFKVLIADRNDQAVEISFSHPVTQDVQIASNNVMALEMERKKIRTDD